MGFNPKKWLFNQLNYYLHTYHNFEGYVDKPLKALWKDLVIALERMVGYGTVAFFSLFGLHMAFPPLRKYISLGSNWYESITLIFLLGLIMLVIKQSYEWKRGVMK